MGKSQRNEFILQPGITLYQRTAQGTKYQSDNWYGYFRIDGNPEPIRRSLKTPVKEEAIRKAQDMFFDFTQKQKRGISLKSNSFTNVARRFLEDYAASVEAEKHKPKSKQIHKPALFRNKKRVVENNLIPFFDGKDIQEIIEDDINAYILKRKKQTYRGKSPSIGTLNKELTVIRNVFSFAVDQKMLAPREVPIIKNLSQKEAKSKKIKLHDREVPGLTNSEFRKLITQLTKDIKNQKNPKHKASKRMCFLYISFLATTGVRVSEAKNIKINDCKIFEKDGKRFLSVYVSAKSKSRTLVASEKAVKVYEWILDFYKRYSRMHGWKLKKSMPLFMDWKGNKINDFKKSVETALFSADLLYDKDGNKRVPGSFRKYYITRALIEGINAAVVAKNCGNSIGTISEYYSKIDPEDEAEKFDFKVI